MDGQSNGDFKAICEKLRGQLKDFAPTLLTLRDDVKKSSDYASGDVTEHDWSEMIANLTLAFRHIEDGSMRIGKAIQAYEGGKSPLDSTLGQK